MAEEHEGEAEKRHFSLKPADSGVAEADSGTHLEIVRQVSGGDYASSSPSELEDPWRAKLDVQGDYIGFRSAAAEDRFLQARRKGAALSFFNTNLGGPPTDPQIT